MIDHIAIPVTDVRGSADFYQELLAPLGITRMMDRGDNVGFGIEFPMFWLNSCEGAIGAPTHVAFTAKSRDAVDAFAVHALALGAAVVHEPRLWSEYHPGYYGVFVADPDGHNVEVVHHTFQV